MVMMKMTTNHSQLRWVLEDVLLDEAPGRGDNECGADVVQTWCNQR
jgi:hypothetical protein